MEKTCDKCVHGLLEKIVKEYTGCVYCEKLKGYMRSDSATICKCYREKTDTKPEPKTGKGDKDLEHYCVNCRRATHSDNQLDKMVYCSLYGRVNKSSKCPNYAEPTSEPEHKADKGKPRLTLVPLQILWDIAEVRRYGVEVKYPETGVDGWRGIGEQRIRDALFRHVVRYMQDPDGLDEESGLPHLWHVATNCAFLCELFDKKEESKDNG